MLNGGPACIGTSDVGGGRGGKSILDLGVTLYLKAQQYSFVKSNRLRLCTFLYHYSFCILPHHLQLS